MPPIGVACSSCPNYVSVNEANGQCRANPPQPFLVPEPPNKFTPPGAPPQIGVRAIWPPVGPNDYCARHPLFAVAVPIDSRLAETAEGSA